MKLESPRLIIKMDNVNPDRKLTAEEIHQLAIAPIRLSFNIISGKSYGSGKINILPVSDKSLMNASRMTPKNNY